MKVHELRLDTKFFDDVASGKKTFEIRNNDRGFRVGDVLALTRTQSGDYTLFDGSKWIKSDIRQAETILKQVVYITDFEQKPGYVVLGINNVSVEFINNAVYGLGYMSGDEQ